MSRHTAALLQRGRHTLIADMRYAIFSRQRRCHGALLTLFFRFVFFFHTLILRFLPYFVDMFDEMILRFARAAADADAMPPFITLSMLIFGFDASAADASRHIFIFLRDAAFRFSDYAAAIVATLMLSPMLLSPFAAIAIRRLPLLRHFRLFFHADAATPTFDIDY